MRKDIHIPLWHHEVVAMYEGRLKALLRPNYPTYDYAGQYEGEVVIVRHGKHRFQVLDEGDDEPLNPWDVSDELAADNGNIANPTPSQNFLEWWRDSMPGRNAPVWVWHLRPVVPETREN